MTIPAVTCGADVSLSYSGSPQNVDLTATATNTPILTWQWRMIEVPPGSVGDIGVNGDFTDGEATIQNPSFNVDASVDGAYVLECIAQNADGFSDPTIDREDGQQIAHVKLEKGDRAICGKYEYDWSAITNALLRSINDALEDHRTAEGGDILNKLDATVAPTVDDDVDLGYAVGSVWCDVTANLAYVCLDAGDGVALWLEISQTYATTAMPSHVTTSLPSASTAGKWIYVTDDVGGAVPAFSDGTIWRRCTDRAQVSAT